MRRFIAIAACALAGLLLAATASSPERADAAPCSFPQSTLFSGELRIVGQDCSHLPERIYVYCSGGTVGVAYSVDGSPVETTDFGVPCATPTSISVSGRDGNDSLELTAVTPANGFTALAGPNRLNGEDGDDILIGSSSRDALSGGAGDDLLQLREGDDSGSGGSGDDELQGETGRDSLFGDSGEDAIEGGDGNDAADGGTEEDRILGDEGNDALDGGGGSDVLLGLGGRDRLRGLAGADFIRGGAARDLLLGGPGTDLLIGGPARDRLRGGPGRDLQIQ